MSPSQDETSPVKPTPDITAVPAQLRDLRQWIAWTWAQGKGEPFRYPNGRFAKEPLKPKPNGKPHKLPINPATGGSASTKNARTWGTLRQAAEAVARFKLTGCGFVFTVDDSFMGVDLDDCRNPKTGELEKWATQIVEELDSYTEVSPSGTGVKIWISAKLPPGAKNQTAIDPGKVEMYQDGRYFAFTGEHLPGTPTKIEARQAAIDQLCQRLNPVPARLNEASPSTDVTLTDGQILTTARGAKNGSKFRRLFDEGDAGDYPSASEADLALCNLLAFYTKDHDQIDRLFRQSGLFRAEKWNRTGKQTIEKAIHNTQQSYRPRPSGPTSSLASVGIANSDDASSPKPPPFRIQNGVLQQRGYNREKKEEDYVDVSPVIEVLAKTVSLDETESGILVSFVGHRGVKREVVINRVHLLGDGSECFAKLVSLGFEPGRNKNQLNALKDYLYTRNPQRLVTTTNRIGWHGSGFVLPDLTIGSAGGVMYCGEKGPHQHKYVTAGTLDQWRDGISRYCSGNSRLLFAVSSAFAAPLLTPVGQDGGGFHFCGVSSLGKSTAAYVAGSVWGGGQRNGFLETWRATANGMEAQAALHNDSLLCLDEMSEVEPKEVAQIVYAISNGRGKARMDKTLGSRPGVEFRVLFLSTGEKDQAALLTELGRQVKGGQEARLVQIDADTGCMGMFEELHDLHGPAELANHLQKAARKFYGTPIRAFLEHVSCCSIDGIGDDFERARGEFLKAAVPQGAKVAGEVYRVVSRFALVAFAGELATQIGITGWKPGEARAAALACYRSWTDLRGGMGSFEIERGIAAVRNFLQTQVSRFQEKPEDKIQNRAGWRDLAVKGNDPESWFFYIYPEVMTREILRGFNHEAVLREMNQRGHLERQGSHLQKKKRLPDGASTRMYCVRATLIDSADDESAEKGGNSGNNEKDIYSF